MTMTEAVYDRCSHAASAIFTGGTVRVPQSIVTEHGVLELLHSIKEWLEDECSMEALDHGREPGYQPREYKVWAEVVPGNGIRVHGKRVG